MAQFASLEHALAVFSSCAEFSAFIAAFRPPVASLLAGNGAANAAVANALSRRHAASNFFIRMGTGTRHAARPEVAALPTERDGNFRHRARLIDTGGGDIGRPSARARRSAVGGAWEVEGAVVGFKLLTSGVLDRPTAPATSEFRKNVTLDSH